MALKLMYITNRPEIAQIAENAGVDRIFIDMEYIGKAERQKKIDSVKSKHTVNDVKIISNIVKKAEIMVRVNPIHEASADYCSSEEEINAAIDAGAKIVMLPYFRTVEEVRRFIQIVDGRAKVFPLVETPQAMAVIDEILDLPGIDEIFIGLNDMSLGLGKKFLFEILADGTVERLCLKFKKKGIPYGFGGIASPGKGLLPAEYIIREHYRLGSSSVILSRAFCDLNSIVDLKEIQQIFDKGLVEIRNLEKECEKEQSYFSDNQKKVQQLVYKICENL